MGSVFDNLAAGGICEAAGSRICSIRRLLLIGNKSAGIQSWVTKLAPYRRIDRVGRSLEESIEIIPAKNVRSRPPERIVVGAGKVEFAEESVL